MRVIAGTYRSRPLVSPRGMDTRPTSDRLRETLFNVLAPRIEDAMFVDLYAGSGAVGIEALSRGASFCWFAEKAPPALRAIRSNLAALKLAGGYAVEDRGVAKLLQSMAKGKHTADIVFLDPPYVEEAEYEATLRALGREYGELLAEGAVVVAEHARRGKLADRYGALSRTRLLEQGDAALSFYSALKGENV
ncbi:MAG TPA: 16S rRNA (guanine(966)-N(2))-methyltransferase RsmD [Acidobacteriaceae bacterium]|jgi:16S rRNA (guanine(966)-N(2))-methyltransferase RsmD